MLRRSECSIQSVEIGVEYARACPNLLACVVLNDDHDAQSHKQAVERPDLVVISLCPGHVQTGAYMAQRQDCSLDCQYSDAVAVV